jgi:hypothetical protein
MSMQDKFTPYIVAVPYAIRQFLRENAVEIEKSKRKKAAAADAAAAGLLAAAETGEAESKISVIATFTSHNFKIFYQLKRIIACCRCKQLLRLVGIVSVWRQSQCMEQ